MISKNKSLKRVIEVWGCGSVCKVIVPSSQNPVFDPQHYINQMRQNMPIITALEMLRQEDQRFKVILDTE